MEEKRFPFWLGVDDIGPGKLHKIIYLTIYIGYFCHKYLPLSGQAHEIQGIALPIQSIKDRGDHNRNPDPLAIPVTLYIPGLRFHPDPAMGEGQHPKRAELFFCPSI